MKENASIRSIKMYGVNLSASCHTISTADIHPELEKQLSISKGKENAIQKY